MPNNQFQPNQPQYYTKPELYPNLTSLLSDECIPEDETERAVFNANRDNMHAFLQSRILDTTESKEQIESVFGDLVSGSTRDPRRAARRQLSAFAREKILDLAMDYRCSAQGMNMRDRSYYLLASRGMTEADQRTNMIVASIVNGGDAQDRGRMFDTLISDTMPMLKRILGGISDAEMIKNFKEFQLCQNVVFNAQNIRLLADREEAPIVITQQTREMLKFMEDNSVLVDLIYQRARAICNPIYEYVDLDDLMQMSDDQFQALQNQAGNATGMSDYLHAVLNVRLDAMMLREDGKTAINDSLAAVTQANKGFFIGSSAYSQAFRSLENLAKFMNGMGEPPSAEMVERLKPMLRQTMEKCKNYMDTKDAPDFKNAREENRYNAMKKALESCRQNLDFYELSLRGEMSAKQNFFQPNVDMEYPSHPAGDVRWQIHAAYGKAHAPKNSPIGTRPTIETTLPQSDVGNIADELRVNIHKSLNNLMYGPNEFDPEYARAIMSNMVVLEMVKNGRRLDEKGQVIAGPVEQVLAERPGEMIDTVLHNHYFRAMTPNVTREMMEHFIVTGGAKTIADNMERIANMERGNVSRDPAPQAQNEMVPQAH